MQVLYGNATIGFSSAGNQLLTQNSIGGVVRLAISINANGSVGRVTPIGGNPILVDAATVAVKQWKLSEAVVKRHPRLIEIPYISSS